MGLRFRRSVRSFPGVRLSASKSGVSLSVGELTAPEVDAEYRRSVIRGRLYWLLIFMVAACYVWSTVGGL